MDAHNRSEDERTLKANTSKLEEKIDELVYQLYELTEDEKNIVRGKAI